VGVDRGAADQVLVELELAEGFEQFARGGDDLRADPVAGKHDYPRGFAHAAGLYALGGDGLDIEADVVEHERLLGLCQDRLGESGAPLGRELVEERPRVTVVMNSSGRSGVTGLGSSQQRTSEKPAWRRRASVSSGPAKFQSPFASPK